MPERILTIAGQVLELFGKAGTGETQLRALLDSGLLQTVLEADFQTMSYERLESVRKSLGLPTLLEVWEKEKDPASVPHEKNCRCGRVSIRVIAGKIRGLAAPHEELVCIREECRGHARKLVLEALMEAAKRHYTI